MYKEQNECCKICGDHYEQLELEVDHCEGDFEKPRKNRGLLCHSCNTYVRHYEGGHWVSQDMLWKVADYLGVRKDQKHELRDKQKRNLGLKTFDDAHSELPAS